MVHVAEETPGKPHALGLYSPMTGTLGQMQHATSALIHTPTTMQSIKGYSTSLIGAQQMT
jgi:hypothetical protein